MSPSTAAPTTRTACDAVAASHAAIDADPRPGIWIELVDRGLAMQRAAEVDARVRGGVALPLAGLTLAVKGNIDVEGVDTTAGCPAYARRPDRSAPAVQALVDAGAVVIGVTNMDQFATGLVGTRSPYGVCPNAHWDGLISGGSSSGSAVAVATGAVDLALGTDTAGSGRVPAAANGIVGMKPTRGRLSLSGVVPACASLDCVSVFAHDVTLAELATGIAASAVDPHDPWHREAPAPAAAGGPVRVGVPTMRIEDFDGEEAAWHRHTAALAALTPTLAPEVQLVELPRHDLDHLVATGRMLYDGAFVAERYTSVGEFIDGHPDQVDPTVRSIISAAGRLPAWRLAADLEALAAARRRCGPIFERCDAVLLPTVPRLPTIAEVTAAPVEVNSMLGTYTNFVNLLDLAAVTFPVTDADVAYDRPPPSLSVVGPAWSEPTLVRLVGTTAGARASRPSR